MPLTAFSFANPRLVLAIVGLASLVALQLLGDFPRREDPQTIIREGIVTVALPGLSAEQADALLTQPLEKHLRAVPGVDRIRSDSKKDGAVLRLTLADEVSDLPPVWQDVRIALLAAQRELPEGTLGPALNEKIGLTAVATVALWAEGFSFAEMEDFAEKIRDDLFPLEGTAQIDIYGAREERLLIEFSNARLAELGISPATIVTTLREQNILASGGSLDAAGASLGIAPSGAFDTEDALRDLLVSTPGNGLVRLGDIAAVRRGYTEPARRPVFFRGEPALVLSVIAEEGVNAVAYGKTLDAHLDEIRGELPLGLVLEYATYQPVLIQKAVSTALTNVLQTVAVVLLVVIIFMGLRGGLIVSTLVPLALLITLVVMRVLEIELHRVSIAAMIIALGMLVDTGIVMVEEIQSRIVAGAAPREAAEAAGKSLAVPLLTSSLTTVLAFLPMLLSLGNAGEYMRALGQVVSIVLITSWLLALTVAPYLAARFLPANGYRPAATRKTLGIDIYVRLLTSALRFRWIVLVAVVAVFVGSLSLFGHVRKEFLPPSDRNQFLAFVDLPAGSDRRLTEEVTSGLSRWLETGGKEHAITSNVAYVSDGGPRFALSLTPISPDPNLSFMVVSTETAADIDSAMLALREYAETTFPETRLRLKRMWFGQSEPGLVEVLVRGPDQATVNRLARETERAIRSIDGVRNVRNNWENEVLGLDAVIDQAQARRAGVTSQDVALSLSAFLSGREVSTIHDGAKTIPIVLKGDVRDALGAEDIGSLRVYPSGGEGSVPLSQVARLEPVFELARVRRVNGAVTATVSTTHKTLSANELAARISTALEGVAVPPGHVVSFAGELEKAATAQSALFGKAPLAGVLILLLLIWQFKSFRSVIIILATVPLSVIGAICGLFLLQANFGFMAILGMFSLAGIIINNGIVLIDRIADVRTREKTLSVAIIEAARGRFRAVLVTTLTTTLGLIPLLILGGPLWHGMATVIICGLLAGTVLTLIVVPVLYSLLFTPLGARRQRKHRTTISLGRPFLSQLHADAVGAKR